MPRTKPAPSAKKTAKKTGVSKKLFNIAERFRGFTPAREALTIVRAVPTIFVQLDHAIGVGGWPIERVSIVHGPSSEGKTLLALGLIRSFLEQGHFALFVDAERTTPIDWVQTLLGGTADSERFFVHRPESYEATVDKVREFCKTVAEIRQEHGPEDLSAIIVVDSMRKLVPEDHMRKILKEGASGARGSIDGMGGRAAQMKAALNAMWMDELVPLLDDTKCAFLGIARESEDPNADVWAKKFGNDYRVGGGKALIYDASLVARVQRAGYLQHEVGGERKVYGERHKVTIRKTKVAGREDKQVICFFHSSNGTLVPAGFDRARDVLELAERFKVHKATRGEHAEVKRLASDAAAFAALDTKVRAEFERNAPDEFDPETGEIT